MPNEAGFYWILTDEDEWEVAERETPEAGGLYDFPVWRQTGTGLPLDDDRVRFVGERLQPPKMPIG